MNLNRIQTISRRLRDKVDEPLELARCITTLAEIAGLNKPTRMRSPNVFKRHPKETPQEKVYRCALLALRQSNKYTPEEVSIMENLDATKSPAHYTAYLRDKEHASATVSALNKIWSSQTRKDILEKLLTDEITAQKVSDELYMVNALRERDALVPPSVPVRETEWAILPREVNVADPEVQRALAGTSEKTQSETPEDAKVDPERTRLLGELAISWGPDAELVVSKLKTGSKNRRYLGVVLPQTLPNGQTIEHFVADNPHLENAMYVWRGEKGMAPDGKITRTWEDVFDKYREDARMLGAKRFNHTATIGERVLEYLTRDPNELNK